MKLTPTLAAAVILVSGMIAHAQTLPEAFTPGPVIEEFGPSAAVEGALPLAKLLPGTLAPGDKLCMNIIRISPDKSRTAAWNPTFTNDGYEPSRFGELELAR